MAAPCACLSEGRAHLSGSKMELVRFDGYGGRYVFRFHNLEDEDMMMANFEVV